MRHHILAVSIGLLGAIGVALYGWLKRPKTVPDKIRVLDRLRGVFPEWSLQRQARVIEHAVDSEIAEARAKKHRERLAHVEIECRDETAEYWDALEELRSNRLIKKASKCGIPMDDLEWETDNYGDRYLTRASQTKLRRAVVEEKPEGLGVSAKDYRCLDWPCGCAHRIGCLPNPSQEVTARHCVSGRKRQQRETDVH